MSATAAAGSMVSDPNRTGSSQGQTDPQVDLAERRKVYRWFVRCAFLFAAHTLAILLVLGYIFSNGFG